MVKLHFVHVVMRMGQQYISMGTGGAYLIALINAKFSDPRKTPKALIFLFSSETGVVFLTCMANVSN